MTSSRAYFARALSTGFVVLFFLSLPLFWLRSLCETRIRATIDRTRLGVKIEPSGLVPDRFEYDPNVAMHSYVSAGVPYTARIRSAIDDFEEARIGSPKSNLYLIEDDGEALFFDRKLGAVVYRDSHITELGDGTYIQPLPTLYAGPLGVSEFPDKVGRFKDLIVGRHSTNALMLYDKKLRQFFRVDFANKEVVKSPKLPKDRTFNPIRLGKLQTPITHHMSMMCVPPFNVALGEDDEDNRHIGAMNVLFNIRSFDSDRYLFVLDKSGRIDRLDRQTLELASPAGFLPAPVTLFLKKKQAAPAELLGYKVLPLATFEDNEYLGMAVAAISRQGSSLALSVFDKDGTLIKTRHTTIPVKSARGDAMDLPSESAIYFARPWAPACTITKYLLENLQSPILLIASYFTADRIEALAGHRAIFVLPNSFLAMFARGTEIPPFYRFTGAIAFMLLAIILAILLTWRITVNALRTGLPRDVIAFWQLATLAFGLPAYITYRLTKPKMVLVTCANCGRLRRPDQENCHRCRSEWHVPELNPPLWRIKDGSTADTLAPAEKETIAAQTPDV